MLFIFNYLLKGVSNMSEYNYEIIKSSVMEWYEKASSDLENITPIYSFHDDDSMQKDEVICALDEALLFCSNYKVK